MYRIGQSIDIHQLVKERDLIIGGVKIEHEYGLLGHSDADVLLHVVIESIIGALALGDIGKHFPDTDPKYKGVSSLVLLDRCYQLMDDKGYEINNLDSIVLIEKPKMAPHIEQMRHNVATHLHCDLNKINIKATRGEKMGFVGNEEGVAAQAVVLLKRKD